MAVCVATKQGLFPTLEKQRCHGSDAVCGSRVCEVLSGTWEPNFLSGVILRATFPSFWLMIMSPMLLQRILTRAARAVQSVVPNSCCST